MKIKTIQLEDFINYKKCSMFIGTSTCTWKCCKECGKDICQNMPLATAPVYDIADDKIVDMYTSNTLTEAIVFGGLEPLDQFDELMQLIDKLRRNTEDDIVIYTGYYADEAAVKIEQLKQYKNIIIKYGRFIPDAKSRYDEVLGITLASDNQYAEKIS